MYVMANRNDPNPKGLLSDDFKDTKKSRKPKLVTVSQHLWATSPAVTRIRKPKPNNQTQNRSWFDKEMWLADWVVAGQGSKVVFSIDAGASESREWYYGIAILETQGLIDFKEAQ